MSDTTYYVRYRVHGTTLWSAAESQSAFAETVDGLQPNTTYDIEVVAQNSLGATSSEIVEYTTAARAPAAPNGLSVSSVTTTSLVLNWNQSPSGSPPISYQPMYRVHLQPSFVNIGTPVSGVTSLLVTGLNASTTYDFQVVASNPAGNATSDPLTVSTLAPGLPPSAPINLTFSSVGLSQLTIGWSPSSGATPITYAVLYRVHGGNTFTTAGTTNNTSLIVSGLLAGTTYDFEVSATNAFGSATSAIGQATTAAAPIAPSQPGAPTAAGVTASSLTLNWTGSLSGTPPVSYQVQFRLSAQTPAANFANFGPPVSVLTEAISGLAAGTAYDFQVVASNAGGTNTSPQTTVTTASAVAPPAAPTGLFSTNVTTTSLTLGWQASATGTAPINYQPQFRVTGTTPFNNIGGTIQTTSIPVTNLTASTSYDFRVVASNGAGNATSALLTVSTSAAGTAPSAPTVTVGATAILGAFPSNAGSGSFDAEFDSFTAAMGEPPKYLVAYTGGAAPVTDWGSTGGGIGNTWLPGTMNSDSRSTPDKVTPVVALPMATSGDTSADQAFQDIANGVHDTVYTDIINTWVAIYPGTLFRPGWEMNGDWEPWAVTTANVAHFISAWRHLYGVIKAASPSSLVIFCPANANQGQFQVEFASIYPGDAYVDIISLDQYGFEAGGVSDSAVSATTGCSVTTVAQFAVAHGKQFAIDETGAGTSNTTFPNNLSSALSAITNLNIHHICLWDDPSGGNSSLYWSDTPTTASAWKSMWGTVKGKNVGATATTIPISWTAATGTGNITYTPQYRVTGSGASFVQAPSTTQLSATLTGLTSGTQYDIQVVATNSVGSTTSSTIMGTTALVESASGTDLTTSTGVIVDHDLTQWRLNGTPRTSATVQRNTGAGWVSSGSSSTASEVLYWSSVVYYVDATGWHSWNGSAWVTASGDPRAGVVESSQGTVLTNATGQIIDSGAHSWTLAASGTTFQVAQSGITDSRTHNVTTLLYWNHTVWYEDTSNLWYSYAAANNTWSAGQTQDPRTGSSAESASGTTLTSTTGQIIDASGAAWKLVTSTSSGLQIAKAGVLDKNTTNVTTLLYWNHGVYFQNASGAWYQYQATQPYPWVSTIDPRGATVTPLFFDDFSTLSLINTRDAATSNNTWHPCFTWNADGFTQDDAWIVNPFNPATPITDLYTITQTSGGGGSSINPQFLDTFSTFSVYNNYYIQPGVGQFVANGVTYTIDVNGNMLGNGSPLNGGGGTGAGAYYLGLVLGKDAGSNNWYSWDGTQFNGPVPNPPSSSFTYTGGTWRYNSFEAAGQGGSDLTGDGLAGDWCLNPLNPATPISGVYVEDSAAGQLKLGILPTPSQYLSAVGNDPFVTTLLSSDITPASTQLFGYFEVTVAVDRLVGFGAEVTLENHHFPWPPEIDLVHIITDANGVMHQTFMVWEGTFPNQTHQKWTQSSASGFDPSAMHSYGVHWTSTNLTFYVDRVQVWQIPTSADYQSIPLYFYLLTYQHYTQLGDPDVDAPRITNTAALPVFAHFDQVGVWPDIPFAGQTTGSGSSDLVLACEATPPAYATAAQNKLQVATTMTTQTSFNRQYGYFEAEMQIPSIPGTNGAFLLYSNNSSTLQIDIQEWASGANSDGSRWQVGSTTIWSTDANTVPLNHVYSYDVSSTFDISAAKHKYGVLLDPSHVTVYWDRVQVAQWPMPPGYIYPLYMLLGTGSGGSWSGSVPGSIPTCTPGSGSFTDTFGNAWSVNGSGNPVVNSGTDTGSHVQRLWLYGTTVWQLDQAGSYYKATITGGGQNAGSIPWTGPFTSGPATNDLPLKVNISYVGCWAGLPFAAPSAATISDIQLSSTTIAGTAASGSLVGTVTVVMSDGNTFGGSLTLGGQDAGSFNLTAAQLRTVGTLVAGSTDTITITATSGVASLQKTFSITISGTGGGGTGGTGPNASSSFITVAMQSPMSYPGGSGQQIVSQRITGAFLGYGADANVPRGGTNQNSFSAFTNSRYTDAMAIANPGVYVVTGNTTKPFWTLDGSGNPTVVNATAMNNLLNNFYKVDPLGISGVIFGADWFGDWQWSQFSNVNTYATAQGNIAAWWDNNGAGRTMPNGKRFPFLGCVGHNEPDGTTSAQQCASYYSAMMSKVKAVNSGYLVHGPQTSSFNGGYTSTFLQGVRTDGLVWDTFNDGAGDPNNPLGTAMYLSSTYATQWANDIPGLFANDLPAGYLPSSILLSGHVGYNCNRKDIWTINGAMWLAVNQWSALNVSKAPVWIALWDDAAQLYCGVVADTNGDGTGIALTPIAYLMGAMTRAVFGPRWNVTTNAAGLMVIACTPPGAHIGVMIINAAKGAQNGKTVAFSNWPVNTSGSATANVWQMTSAVQGLNQDGARSTIPVVNGVTTTNATWPSGLNFPDPSITIIWI